MRKEKRTVYYDSELGIEAYRFEGVMQKFPNHFHEYYVIGFIENGRRCLLCNHKEYQIGSGDMVLFNPLNTHTCEPVDGRALDYRAINIKPEIMKRAVLDITGSEDLPVFNQNVIYQSELTECLRDLHRMIFEEETDFKKEELFLLLIEQLLRDYSDTVPEPPLPQPSLEIMSACDYLESNYAEVITLEDLSSLTGLSKYHFLRSFTRQKGISPYSYLEAVRISKAKMLLENGVLPVEVALQTGFSDQSHFTNFFKKLIGLTPKQYGKIFSESTKLSGPGMRTQTGDKEILLQEMVAPAENTEVLIDKAIYSSEKIIPTEDKESEV